MSPKVPQAYLDARRDEIIQAAYECFETKGFHNTTMQDIYEATKLSPGAVYNYFSSKEEIIISTMQKNTDWSIASVTPLLAQNQPDILAKCLEFWLSRAREDKNNKYFNITLDFYAEATRNKDIHKAVTGSHELMHNVIIEIIKQNQQKGLINKKLDPLSVARVIGGMIFGAAIHKMLDPNVDVDAYNQACAAMLTGAFAAPPRPKK